VILFDHFPLPMLRVHRTQAEAGQPLLDLLGTASPVAAAFAGHVHSAATC